MEIRNKYRVGRRIWKTWSPGRRYVFNEMFRSMMEDWWAYRHPAQRHKPNIKHWKTTCWNVAWTASGYIDNPYS